MASAPPSIGVTLVKPSVPPTSKVGLGASPRGHRENTRGLGHGKLECLEKQHYVSAINGRHPLDVSLITDRGYSTLTYPVGPVTHLKQSQRPHNLC